MAVLLALAGAVPLLAAPADNPYRVISENNAFRLNPPPPPMTNLPPPVEEPVNLRFTGLAWHNEEVSAFLVINPVGPTATPIYLTLAPGERSDGVELVSVDEASGEVTVNYQGKSRQIAMEKITAPALGRPGGIPAVPGVPGVGARPTAAIPGINNAVANRPGGGAVANPSTLQGIPAPPVNPAARNMPNMPTRQVRGQQGVPQGGAVANPTPTVIPRNNDGNERGNRGDRGRL